MNFKLDLKQDARDSRRWLKQFAFGTYTGKVKPERVRRE